MNNFKEKSEISLHLVRIWEFFKSNKARWASNQEIQSTVKFSPRTVRMHTLYLVRSGLIDQQEVFPGHRYRLSDVADKRNKNFFERLEKAIEIFQI